MSVKTGTLIQSPDRIYSSPSEILSDDRLTEEEKLKALQNWEADVKSQLRADDENMTCAAPPEGPAPEEIIKKIQKAERKLDGNEQDTGTKNH